MSRFKADHLQSVRNSCSIPAEAACQEKSPRLAVRLQKKKFVRLCDFLGLFLSLHLDESSLSSSGSGALCSAGSRSCFSPSQSKGDAPPPVKHLALFWCCLVNVSLDGRASPSPVKWRKATTERPSFTPVGMRRLFHPGFLARTRI